MLPFIDPNSEHASDEAPQAISADATPIAILYEEPHFMVVSKPAGLFTQAAPGVPSLELALTQQLKDRDAHPGSPFVGLPHRLDRATSGVLLIARNQRALAKFGQQFQSRKITKFYLALVQGVVPAGVQHWSDHLRKIQDVAKTEIVAADAEGARLAELRIEPIATTENLTLAVVELLTGRMHQIRVQCASRGYPVIGDSLYGSEQTIVDSGDEVSTLAEERERPQALHAYRMGFFHPQNAKAISCSAPLPEYWQAWLPFETDQVDAAIAGSQLLQATTRLQAAASSENGDAPQDTDSAQNTDSSQNSNSPQSTGPS